jgi:hypothetical protein
MPALAAPVGIFRGNTEGGGSEPSDDACSTQPRIQPWLLWDLPAGGHQVGTMAGHSR